MEYFPGFNTLQLSEEIKKIQYRLVETPEIFTRRILFISMFNDISCGTKTMKKNVWQMPNSYLCTREDLEKRQWSFIGPGSKKKWYSISKDNPQGIWDYFEEKMLVEFADNGCPIFRAMTPLSRGQLKSKRHGKLSIHYCADQETLETSFRIIVSANQLILYGAVANMCEECESLHERTGRQSSSSLVLSAIKTEVPLDSDDPAYENFLLQQFEERLEKLSR